MSVSISAFADKMEEIMPVMIKEFSRRCPDELYKGKITLPQFLTLGFLIKKGESKMKDLADFMGVSTAAITGIVDRLVKCSYVERQYEPEDRRIVKVRPTPKGMAIVEKIKKHRRQSMIDIFGELSDKDREDYLRVVSRIKEVLEHRRIE